MNTILDARFTTPPLEPRTVSASAGVGFKPAHADAMLSEPNRVGFIEVHAENYMGAGGHPHAQLARMCEHFPLSVHGVGMSIGGEQPLDRAHLARFKAVVDRYGPGLVSEHLAWSTHEGVYLNDLLPLPYTTATLTRVVEHVQQVQDAIRRAILIENPSTYLSFDRGDFSEVEFLAELSRRSGCGLLLDVNNVFVSATNHGTSASDYLRSFPLDRVGEIHLGGHAPDHDDEGRPLLIDAHDREVADPVWQLCEAVLTRTGPVPTLIEWDNDVPDWTTLAREVARADAMVRAATAARAA